MQEVHLRLLNGAAALAVVAMRAGSHQVSPGMRPAEVAWDDMVDRQGSGVLAAILAGVVIATKHLALGQFDARVGTVNHLFQADDGWTRVYLPNGLNLAASIQDEAGFSINNEGNGTAGIADIDRLEVGVKN